ncbi:MAG TPA: alpha-ketoacid dehydrogenase subunit beta [Clostridiales bacterium]|jgi:pyruvate dehydrogenase E1 component beta subunit|nr:alpha-ketoacid dehydrogenase subunit beta [Clostridiales bacterium]
MATKRFIHAMRDGLIEEMRMDPTVFVMGEDVKVGVFGISRGLIDEFGADRIRNTPISENVIAGATLGAAASGMRPVADMMMANFLYLAMEPLGNQASKLTYMTGGQIKMPAVFLAAQGAPGGNAAHHSESIHPILMNLGSLKVVYPTTPYDAKGLLKSAIRDNNPVVFLYHISLGGSSGEVPDEEFLVPIGKGEIKKEGSDVTVVAMGLMVRHSLKVAGKLEKEGISVEVIDPRSLVPLDTDIIINSVKKTGRLVVVDEARQFCSAASEISACVSENAFGSLKSPILRVTTPNLPIPFSPPLETHVVPNVEKIDEAIRKVLVY